MTTGETSSAHTVTTFLPGARARIGRHRIFAIVATLSLVACTSTSSAPRGTRSPHANEVTPSEAGPSLSQDVLETFRFYREEHARPFSLVDRGELRSAYYELARRADELSRDEFLVGLMRVMALPGHNAGRDGHSGIYPLDYHRPQLDLYPLQLYWFPEGLFVTRVLDGDKDLVGAELTAIAGTPISKITDAVAPLVPRDNPMTLRARLPLFLLTHEVLAGLGIAARDAEFVFRTGSRVVRRILEPIPGDDYATEAGYFDPLVPSVLPPHDRPLYLRHKHQDFFLTYLDAEDAIYLQYNLTIEDTEAIAQRVRRLLRETGAEKMIVDLRHNPGGNNFTYGDLVSALTSGHVATSSDRYALIGRGTFSAAGQFAMELRAGGGVTFAGEPPGFAPRFFGDPETASLGASGLTINVAGVEWTTTHGGDDRLLIRPDLHVPLTAAAYFAGRDPILEAVLEL